MTRWLGYRTLVAALLVAFLGSLAANLWLWQRSDRYYRELNALRLDPYGLQTFPAATPTVADPNTGTTTVVFVGDSRAAEWVAPDDLAGYRFLNRGIGSQTSVQVLGRYAAHVAPLRPDIVVIQVGFNDLKTMPLGIADPATLEQECYERIAALVQAAQADQATVILTTIMPIGPIPLERQLYWSPAIDAARERINAKLLALAGPEVIVLDTQAILADATGQLRAEYTRDEVHLNPAGYTALNQALRQLLSQ
ncbi:MAG: hypothetical protein OHK0050_20610 [Roseiflexaceae bacterium]